MSPQDDRHGTTTSYRSGCRCDSCRRACADAMAERRKRLYLARADALTVSSVGTKRRIQALVALGWSLAEVSRRAGYDKSHANLILSRKGPLQAGTAARIAATFEELSTMAPPERTKVEKIDATRARNLAARRGWAPPNAWLDIDDATETPDPGYRELKTRPVAQTVEEWDHLRSLGVSIDQAARQLGVTVGAIERAVERMGEVA